jgi:hypothetical protein
MLLSGINSRHTQPRALIVCQLPNQGLGTSSASLEPHDVIKAPDPYNISMGVPDPLGIFLPRSRDTWSPLARRGAMGALTATPIPADGTDMTVHSEQERGNRALIQHDPGHSTTTTSIPLQRQG